MTSYAEAVAASVSFREWIEPRIPEEARALLARRRVPARRCADDGHQSGGQRLTARSLGVDHYICTDWNGSGGTLDGPLEA